MKLIRLMWWRGVMNKTWRMKGRLRRKQKLGLLGVFWGRFTLHGGALCCVSRVSERSVPALVGVGCILSQVDTFCWTHEPLHSSLYLHSWAEYNISKRARFSRAPLEPDPRLDPSEARPPPRLNPVPDRVYASGLDLSSISQSFSNDLWETDLRVTHPTNTSDNDPALWPGSQQMRHVLSL